MGESRGRDSSHNIGNNNNGNHADGDARASSMKPVSRLKSIPSLRAHDDHLLHYPSAQLLNSSYNMSLRSPRILNQQPAGSDFFHLDTSDSGLQPHQHPGLLRQQSLPPQFASYGAINTDSKHGQTSVLTSGQDSTEKEQLETNFYDDFTTIDWLDNSIRQSDRSSHLARAARRSWRKKFVKNLDNAKSWILIVIISFFCALLAYCIDTVENVLIDLKRGYCATSFFLSESACCAASSPIHLLAKSSDQETLCPNFRSWSTFFPTESAISLEFCIYASLCVFLAFLAVHITLLTKTINPLLPPDESDKDTSGNKKNRAYSHKVWYTAYGSGVPEVKTILSGFVIRKFLGTWTLICKATSLVLAIASGMALGKEGPYVHLSACIGNICCRIFDKINNNDLEKRQILSAATSAGVALAFGSPLGAVLFSIEEVTYYLPINQLFHIFICAMSSTLFLKFLNPYGTGKTVLFEVTYTSDWEPIELVFFIFIGVAGGIFGAAFCTFTQWWARTFRQTRWIKDKPVFEVLLVAAITAVTTYYNKYTKIPTTELLYEMASPCTIANHCPILDSKSVSAAGEITVTVSILFDKIMPELKSLSWALLIKVVLTSITFGAKLPAGIYVPSMTIGALFGRLSAMLIQFLVLRYPHLSPQNSSAGDDYLPMDDIRGWENVTCVDFGIYAMVGAGAFMAGITRMNVTLAAILFELTSSYTYVLPISIAIAISNWVANMIEPNSLYELLIAKNDFPFLDNRSTPVFLDQSARLIDLVPSQSNLDYVIDITDSPYFPVSVLHSKLALLQQNSLLDGCLSVVKNHGDTIVGLLPAPNLRFELDKLASFLEEYEVTDEMMVKLGNSPDDDLESNDSDLISDLSGPQRAQEEVVVDLLNKLTDLTTIIDYNPIYLDHDSKLSLVYSIFTKLGNREICVLDEDGKFCGTLHKKVFIDYCKRQKAKTA